MRRLLFAMVILTLTTLPGLVRAEEEAQPGYSREERVERLRRLKTEDPEKFRQIMQEKQAKLRERLEYLKKNDPEKYRQVTAKLKERR